MGDIFNVFLEYGLFCALAILSLISYYRAECLRIMMRKRLSGWRGQVTEIMLSLLQLVVLGATISAGVELLLLWSK